MAKRRASLHLKAALAGVARSFIGFGVLGGPQIVNSMRPSCGKLTVPRGLKLQAEFEFAADVVTVTEVGAIRRRWLPVGPRAEGATIGVA